MDSAAVAARQALVLKNDPVRDAKRLAELVSDRRYRYWYSAGATPPLSPGRKPC